MQFQKCIDYILQKAFINALQVFKFNGRTFNFLNLNTLFIISQTGSSSLRKLGIQQLCY